MRVTMQDINNSIRINPLIFDEILKEAKKTLAKDETVKIFQIKGGELIKEISTVDELEEWEQEIRGS